MSVNTNPVLGVVVVARHGDRLGTFVGAVFESNVPGGANKLLTDAWSRIGFYQSPNSYTASATVITPLGEQQEYELGASLQKKYLDPASADAIVNISPNILVAAQVTSTADGGGEGGVIFDSAIALWQGLYPPSPNLFNSTLANGSVVTSPLGGYQYLQINSILPSVQVNLEAYTGCNNWVSNLANFTASPVFLAKEAANKPFLDFLAGSGLVGGRAVTLANMWNVFDFMNVQNIHDATYAGLLAASGSSTLAQVRALADWKEYYSFTSQDPGGIGNVAGRSFLPLVIADLQGFTGSVNASTVRLNHFQIAYKPFLSIFNMTNVAAAPGFPNPQSIVDYASVATFELRKSVGTTGSGFDVRFGFRNGSSATGESGPINYYPLFGSSSIDMDLTTFTNNLEPYLLNNITSWCTACNNNSTASCQYIMGNTLLTSTTSTSAPNKVSRVGAGFIGAGVTLFLGILLVLFLIFTKRLLWGGMGRNSKRSKGNVVPLRTTGGSSYAGSALS